MPRRPAIRTLALYAAALTAATAFAPPPVLAQLASPTDSVLLKPVLDGDPKNPPRFQRTANGVAVQSGDDTGTLGTSPGSGAGTTGFLSVPGKGKSKKSPKAKPANGAAASAPINAPNSPVTPIVKVTPIGAAKLPQNRTRPGAPVRAMVPALATDPDLAPELLPAPPPRPTPPPGQLPIPQSPTVSPLPDEHPFAPTGIVAGAFRLRPALEVTGGYDTNPSRSSPNAIPSAATTTLGGSPTYIVAPELLVNSMWSRHELTAAIHGSYTGYTRFSSLNRPNFDAKVDGRIDVTSLTHINLESRYLVYTDNPGSPNIPAGLSRYPLAQDWGATAGIDQQFNRFQVTLKGLADRTIYQNSDFTDGEVSSNKDRNFNQYQYNEPLRLPRAPGLSLAGLQLIIPDHALGSPVLRMLSLCTCCRHYPGTAAGRTASLIHPSRISLPRKGCRVGLCIVLFEDCSAFTRVTACTLALSPYFVTR